MPGVLGRTPDLRANCWPERTLMAKPLRPAMGSCLSYRSGKLRWSLLLTVLPACVLAASQVRNSTDLVDARTALKEISQTAPSTALHASESATLVSDIHKFRAAEGGASPRKVVQFAS